MNAPATPEALSTRDAALYCFWARCLGLPVAVERTNASWNEQEYYLSSAGIGTKEALSFLYSTRADFAAFLQWLETNHQRGHREPYDLQEDVLTAEDMRSWHENGYVVVKNAVPPAHCAAARDAIWQCLGAGIDNPDSWYAPHKDKSGMMLEFFQHPALDTNRHAPRIRKAYEQLYGNADIFLLVDKVSFNAPESEHHRFAGSALHWDVSLQLPIPFALQGLLYLNDVSAADGAFHCVPGFHNRIGDWLAGLPGGVNPREQALTELEPVAIPGNAGDLIIWHQALPHCATPNKGTAPRMVQYIAYKPLKMEEASIWK